MDSLLPAVPKGTWLCPECKQHTESPANDVTEVIDLTGPRLDITQDLPTVQYLKDSTFPLHASEQDKLAIRIKSMRYRYDSEQLFHRFHCFSDKPVPDIEDRPDIVANAHGYGHSVTMAFTNN